MKGQDMEHPPSISSTDYELEAVHESMYLGSTISDSLSLEIKIYRRIRKATTTFPGNSKLTEHTKVKVYTACILSTLLYGSQSWTLCLRQEGRLHSFNMHCLRHIFGISWREKYPTT